MLPTESDARSAIRTLDDAKISEETKRAAMQDPLSRWKETLEFLDWAASQTTAPKATPAARKAKERRLLVGLAEWLKKKPERAIHDTD
jgi:hypothetical protein